MGQDTTVGPHQSDEQICKVQYNHDKEMSSTKHLKATYKQQTHSKNYFEFSLQHSRSGKTMPVSVANVLIKHTENSQLKCFSTA
jgi:hypothetical protein